MKCPLKINTTEQCQYSRHPTSHKVTASKTVTTQEFGTCYEDDCPWWDRNAEECKMIGDCI